VHWKTWSRASAVAILAVCLMLWTGCSRTRSHEYLPVTKQVYMAPEGTLVTAPAGGEIVTDDAAGKRRMPTVVLPYDAVIISTGRFLELYELALRNKGDSGVKP